MIAGTGEGRSGVGVPLDGDSAGVRDLFLSLSERRRGGESFVAASGRADGAGGGVLCREAGVDSAVAGVSVGGETRIEILGAFGDSDDSAESHWDASADGSSFCISKRETSSTSSDTGTARRGSSSLGKRASSWLIGVSALGDGATSYCNGRRFSVNASSRRSMADVEVKVAAVLS